MYFQGVCQVWKRWHIAFVAGLYGIDKPTFGQQLMFIKKLNALAVNLSSTKGMRKKFFWTYQFLEILISYKLKKKKNAF